MNLNNTLLGALGIEITENTAERCVAVMPVDKRTVQPFGYLHGGASAALAETVASVGAQHFIDRSNQACVGLEINANHLKSVKEGGTVTAIAKPVHTGRATIVYEINIFDERERLICISRCTLAVITK
ncbi:hotdog fold thioesterase [Bacillus amyloliquefaciens]|uniref:hotdog fold thioesterase n=1 Tax=Bacillus TaxID=1386 RepID=UPI0006AF0871|nr:MULTISPECIES: hotdog fold thioesterase [Bacillus]AMR51522.1 esterase [Bacillus amyloliquefaciens]AWD88950.1 esterase [Bacillus velezensis]AWM52861.1 hotdog fold thioesterase [Bacillus amyloliquefaciens]KAF6691036.1 hotdog fold thioesterase [Bacillus sp. EKM601B]KOS49565.1 esterase [Bacillus amyloliquefaciens]